jgi:hypothetical protein
MCKGSPSSEVLVCTDGIANVGLGALETGEVSEIFLLFFFSLLFLLFSSPYEDFVLHSFFHINNYHGHVTESGAQKNLKISS